MSRRLDGFRTLGAARAEAFLRAARADDGCFAVGQIAEELDAGHSFESLLSDREHGYHLEVTRDRSNRFRISFSCHPGLLVGDGGTWEVEFNDAGVVVRCVPSRHSG